MTQLVVVDPGSCTGCKTCELVCSLSHYGECKPERAAIRVVRRERGGLLFALPLLCQQCLPAPCADVCPTGAISREARRGTLVVYREMCTACGDCLIACPIGCIRIDHEKDAAFACDLCGGEPECVAFCHARCLTLVSLEESSGTHNMSRLASILKSETFAGPPTQGE